MQQAVDLALLREADRVQLRRERAYGLGDDPDGRVGFRTIEEFEDVGMAQSSELAKGVASECEQRATVAARGVGGGRCVKVKGEDGYGCRIVL